MIFSPIVAVLGGDVRQFSLARYFAKTGYRVNLYGLPREDPPNGVYYSQNWRNAVSGAAAVILPLPASSDGAHLSLPAVPTADPPLLTDIVEELPRGTLLAGGKLPATLKTTSCRARLFDYFESEVLQQKNALPTAEGAVFVLMREVPRTVHGLPVLVTGYGRVAQALVTLLLAMGADVTVTARSATALALAAEQGAKTVPLTNSPALAAASAGQTVVFNTVPARLFSDEVLACMPKKTLLIDLASSPGGVDAAAAAACGIRVIWALSLPGKYAPESAGELIAETVLSCMRGEVTV